MQCQLNSVTFTLAHENREYLAYHVPLSQDDHSIALPSTPYWSKYTGKNLFTSKEENSADLWWCDVVLKKVDTNLNSPSVSTNSIQFSDVLSSYVYAITYYHQMNNILLFFVFTLICPDVYVYSKVRSFSCDCLDWLRCASYVCAELSWVELRWIELSWVELCCAVSLLRFLYIGLRLLMLWIICICVTNIFIIYLNYIY